MASPLVTRSPPTCLASLRRLTWAGRRPIPPPVLTQLRGSKAEPQKGVIVRLLKDMKGFGKKYSILRTERGRMRNQWFPTYSAEYMTAARFAQLGLTKDDIVERDPLFGMKTVAKTKDKTYKDPVLAVARKDLNKKKAVGEARVQPAITIQSVSPSTAFELLTSLVPETLTFKRRLIKKPEPPKKKEEPPPPPTPEEPKPEPARHISPLLAARATVLQPAPEPEKKPEPEPGPQPGAEHDALAIHGSVSATDVATEIRNRMLLDVKGSRVHVAPEDVRFVLPAGAAAETDKVKRIGRFEVVISAVVGGYKVRPVKKMVEVLAS